MEIIYDQLITSIIYFETDLIVRLTVAIISFNELTIEYDALILTIGSYGSLLAQIGFWIIEIKHTNIKLLLKSREFSSPIIKKMIFELFIDSVLV